MGLKIITSFFEDSITKNDNEWEVFVSVSWDEASKNTTLDYTFMQSGLCCFTKSLLKKKLYKESQKVLFSFIFAMNALSD